MSAPLNGLSSGDSPLRTTGPLGGELRSEEARVGYRMSVDEAWDQIAGSNIGILTTLRRDGHPIALPVWFVVRGREIWIGAPAATKKVRRVEHDARASFLVESGERWTDLVAVHLTGTCEVVPDLSAISDVVALLDTKYRSFRTAEGTLAQETEDHYDSRVFIRFVPDERVLSWRNAGAGRAGG